jgi:hypothetical protein
MRQRQPRGFIGEAQREHREHRHQHGGSRYASSVSRLLRRRSPPDADVPERAHREERRRPLHVVGELTLRGTSKSLCFGHATDTRGGKRIGFEAETTNRKNYGSNWNAALESRGLPVGDEVQVTLAIQAVAK